MIASKVSATVLLNAAQRIGVKADVNSLSATRHRVKLYPDPGPECYTSSGRRRKGSAGDSRYQRESAGYGTAGHRVNAVCWHGFRDFFREVYQSTPEAVFRTSLAVWKGSEHFEENFPESGHKNIGPPIAPVPFASACRCPESGMVDSRREAYAPEPDPIIRATFSRINEPIQDDYGQDEADGAACRAFAAALRATQKERRS